MATVLKKKLTEKDSDRDIIHTIHMIAKDKNTRVLLTDCLEWEQEKMKEIARLSLILKNRKKHL